MSRILIGTVPALIPRGAPAAHIGVRSLGASGGCVVSPVPDQATYALGVAVQKTPQGRNLWHVGIAVTVLRNAAGIA